MTDETLTALYTRKPDEHPRLTFLLGPALVLARAIQEHTRAGTEQDDAIRGLRDAVARFDLGPVLPPNVVVDTSGTVAVTPANAPDAPPPPSSPPSGVHPGPQDDPPPPPAP